MNKFFSGITDWIVSIGIKREWVEKIVQFIQFGIVGLSNTMISYIVYIIMVYFHFNYLLASVCGFMVSVINAFYWNNKYVFKQQGEGRNLLAAFMKTFIAYAGTGLVLHNILLIFWVRVCGMHEMLAPIVNLVITVPLNFVLNKVWAFREKTK